MINSVLIEVIGAMAEQERIKTRARQAEGIAIAKANGRYANVGGSKPKQIDKFKLADVYNKWVGKQITTKQAIEVLEVSRATFYKRIKDLRT
jgi:DNA invertase Pin-like site-specific DNA recombinase